MTKYIVQGGHPLFGEVEISGAKNAAVAIIPAALLVDGVCRIENIPQISDVTLSLKILEHLGAGIRVINRHTVEIDSSHIRSTRTSYELARKMRASYYLIGALLGRFGQAEVAMPGGCNFGVRPIDQHVKGFTALGAKVMVEGGFINASTENGRLKGASIYLDVVSVGATMNIMMAAVRAEGNTIIENAAKEPHIVDLANFLNSMGARVKGAGTDVIRIRGMQHLHHCTYTVIPDQIETGTLMIAAAATRGDVTIHGCIPTHMEALSAKLLEMGVYIREEDDLIHVRSNGRLRAISVKTQGYPGFPTDLQQPMTALLTVSTGSSVVTENIFDSRFKYVSELERMGARIRVIDNTAIIEGVDRLVGTSVHATDLRAGAAMVIAGLCARGVTLVEDIQFIERGYENFVGKLRLLGADIRIIDEPDGTERGTAVAG